MTAEIKADFAAVRRMLDRLQASWEPAEAHGAFCGRACLSGAAALQDWLQDINRDAPTDADNALLHEAGKQLQAFAADSLVKLEAGQLGFRLCLPDDDVALEQRTAALADWCHGFMHGLSSAGGGDQGAVADVLEDGEMGEILDDFSAITNAAADGEADEAGESAFTELAEYVRVSVQLVYEETAAMRKRPAGPAEK